MVNTTITKRPSLLRPKFHSRRSAMCIYNCLYENNAAAWSAPRGREGCGFAARAARRPGEGRAQPGQRDEGDEEGEVIPDGEIVREPVMHGQEGEQDQSALDVGEP